MRDEGGLDLDLLQKTNVHFSKYQTIPSMKAET